MLTSCLRCAFMAVVLRNRMARVRAEGKSGGAVDLSSHGLGPCPGRRHEARSSRSRPLQDRLMRVRATRPLASRPPRPPARPVGLWMRRKREPPRPSDRAHAPPVGLLRRHGRRPLSEAVEAHSEVAWAFPTPSLTGLDVKPPFADPCRRNRQTPASRIDLAQQ